MARTVGSGVELGDHALPLLVPIAVLLHALERVEGRRRRSRRLAHADIVAEDGVERAVSDAFPQVAVGGDLGSFFLGEGFGLGDFEGLASYP